MRNHRSPPEDTATTVRPPAPLSWAVSGHQHAGRRESQQDALRIVDLLGNGTGPTLVVVCDGMGGHSGGEVASAVAADGFVDWVQAAVASGAFRFQGGLVEEAVEPVLREGLAAANTAIAERLAEGGPEGMGTTLLAGLVLGRDIAWISVGDSPLWVVRRGLLLRLNADHSMGAVLDELARQGKLTAEEAKLDRTRSALRSALTGEDIAMVDVRVRRDWMEPGDTLLFASDGVLTLDDRDILAWARQASHPGPAAASLVDRVMAAGERHQDNVTVVCLSNDWEPADRAPDEPKGLLARIAGFLRSGSS